MFTIDSPLEAIPSLKKHFLSKFRTLGIYTVRDLLFHIPARYEDYAIIKKISDAAEDELATFAGILGKIREKKSWKRKMTVFETDISDETGSLKIIWFNQKLVAENLHEGLEVRVSGKVSSDQNGLLLASPAIERSTRRPTHTARLLPIYPETYGLTSKYLRWQIEMLFEKKLGVPDPLPEELISRLNLPTLPETLRMLHFPKSMEEVEVARKRLAWDDMFLAQLKSLDLQSKWDKESAIPFQDIPSFLDDFAEALPFRLTGAQERASKDILADLAKSHPMNRLVNGDVGSGKTAVAAIAMARVARDNFQSALLAPTEILARQHFETLSLIFSNTPVHVALLTRSEQRLAQESVSKETLKNAIRSGLPDIVVGTHAILQKDVHFKKLALVVVDEQHRFGVSQRASLQEKTRLAEDGVPQATPHLLTLTATPIPRTLAIAFLGTLSLSILDELPKNRSPIVTKIAADAAARETVFKFARQEIRKGRQVFIILPLIEESATLSEVKAATTEHKKLSQRVFPEFQVGLLHGKMKSPEKESVMRDFKENRLSVLVSTSVVEVGIDVPNATVMIIENADRFGLSQLHQFRGRVGRGSHASYCFLLPGKKECGERLRVLANTADGFAIAEKDLELRGPGAFFGTRQSGIPDTAMSHLGNTRLIELSRREAVSLLSKDPTLSKYPRLRSALDLLGDKAHFE